MPGTIGPRLHRRPASASLRPLPLFTMLRSAPPPLLAERHTRRPALRCIHHIAVATVIVTRFDDHKYRYVRFGCIYKTRTVVGIAAYSLQFWLRKGVGHGGILGIRAALPSAAGARRTVVVVERARSSCVNCEVCQQRRRRKQARPRRHARGKASATTDEGPAERRQRGGRQHGQHGQPFERRKGKGERDQLERV